MRRTRPRRLLLPTALVLALTACAGEGSTDDDPVATPTPTPTEAESLVLTDVSAEVVTEDLAVPREVVEAGSDTLLISDQTGRVVVVRDGTVRAEPFLDVSDEVLQPSSEELELGLAGFALSPDFAETGRFFTYTTAAPPKDADEDVTRVDTLTRWEADPDTLRADPDSAVELFAHPRTIKDHVGGEIVFDAEGVLYTSFGAETFGAPAQEPDAIDGSVVRVDPDRPGSDEIFPYGYRNPWRLYHDADLGLLVGEAMWRDKFQQVTVAEEGGNFGYPEVSRHTKQCWDGDDLNESCRHTAQGEEIVPPVLEYPPDIGSIISGVVRVHDGTISDLAGAVLISDWEGTLIAAIPDTAPWRFREVTVDALEPPEYAKLWDLDHADGAIYLMYAQQSMQEGTVVRLTGS